jgi:nucleotide-binding universal stress UspA family protein
MSPALQVSRLLVGVEFDDASASALKLAGLLAAAWNAEITVFHSVTPDAPVYFTASQLGAIEAEREQDREGTAGELRAFAEPLVGHAVRVLVEEGPPQHAMVRLAASFDLVVVGTHRRQGARRWWLGSVAEAVVRRSPRPVLVVPAGALVPEAGRPLSVLVAGDDSPETDAWAGLLGDTFGGRIDRSPDLHRCAPERLRNTDLIVLRAASWARTRTQLEPVAQVLKECVHLVLFVPPAGGTPERSPS